jgi:hypothetical protein
MAKKKPAPKLAVDVKALAAELGTTVKEGVVTAVRDRYYLTVGRRKLAIPTDEMNTKAEVRKLVGKRVPTILSGSTIVAIGYPGVPFCYILCYVPAPDILRRVRPELRVELVNRYTKMNVISAKLGKNLLAGLIPIQLP